MTTFLLDALERSVARGGSLTLTSTTGDKTLPWSDVHALAIRLAGYLQRAGVRRGTAVGLLGLTDLTMVTAIRSIWLAGASATVLTPPISGDPVAVNEAVTTAVHGAALDVLLVCPPFDPFIDDLTAVLAPMECRSLKVDLADIPGDAAASYTPVDLTEDDIALRQFTSGSTAAPKAVRITHGNLGANLRGIMTTSRHDQVHATMLSWLPLYHDMGLIGFLTLPMVCGGCHLVLSSPEDFLARPTSWLENLSRFRATATAAPNFAYNLASRLLRPDANLDLSHLRFALCGGEPIDPEAIARFTTSTAPFGLDPKSIVCAFGMAEATLAVSLAPFGRGIRVEEVDTAVLERDRVAVPADSSRRTSDGTGRPATTRLPRLGPPLPGMRIRIIDPETGVTRHEREIGEVEISGTSLSPGYVNEGSDGQPRPDGWLPTGDLGYLVDEELVVCGRIKEVIIAAGRNILPYEVERAVSRVAGVRAGRVAAFRGPDTTGTDTLIVAVETRSANVSDLRKAIIQAVVAQIGIRPREITVLPPGTLPKTTSGKMRRTEIRRRYLSGELTGVAVEARV